jgi:hypothetical protein
LRCELASLETTEVRRRRIWSRNRLYVDAVLTDDVLIDTHTLD